MPSSIARLPATFAGLATLCIVTAMSGSGWGDVSSAVPDTRAGLMQWHSVLMVPCGSCMNQDWNSTLSAIPTRDAVQFHAAPGTAASGENMDRGCDPAPDSRDAPADACQPARDATGKPHRSNLISR